MPSQSSTTTEGWPDDLTGVWPDNSTGLRIRPSDPWFDVYDYRVGPRFPLATWSVLIGISTIFVGLRIVARLRGIGQIRIDDYVLLAGWLSGLGFLIPFVIVAADGDQALGFDGTVYPDEKQVRAAENVMKAMYAAFNFGCFSITMSKLSLIILYWIVLDGISTMRKWLIAFTVFFVVTSAAQQLGMLFECIPISNQWKLDFDYDNYIDTTDIAFGNSRCVMELDWIMQLFHGCVSIVTDLGIFALSIPLLHRAGLGRKDAIGIFAMFSLSLVTMGASIATMVTMTIYTDIGPGLTWGFVELSTCLMVASMVSLRSLFNDMVSGFRHNILRRRSITRKDAGCPDLEDRLTSRTGRKRTREVRELEFRTEVDMRRAQLWWDEENEMAAQNGLRQGGQVFKCPNCSRSQSNRSQSRSVSRGGDESENESKSTTSISPIKPVILRS